MRFVCSELVQHFSVLTDEAALQLSNLILSAVQNGLPAAVERALQVTKQHSPSSQFDGSLVLDFLAENPSLNVRLLSVSVTV